MTGGLAAAPPFPWGAAWPVPWPSRAQLRRPFGAPLRNGSEATPGASGPVAGALAPAAAAAAEAVGGFDVLVARHRDRVFRVALSVLGPGAEADAEDVAQEVFVRAFRRLGSFRGDSQLGTWLYRVSFNLAVDYRRRARRRGETVGDGVLETLPAAVGDPDRAARQAESERVVRRLLDTLPESQRAALHLHYWMGHTVVEIAELLNTPEGTVKAHLHRGRERLRVVLEEREETP